MSYLKRAEASQSSQLIPTQYSSSPYSSMTYKPYLLKEDGEQKIPLFLIKLWNIVEDPAYQEVVRWDETGLSFHIMDPYAFCSNILPQYFKHKNLNSLVRQLNMYGFRKNTPIDRSGLARAESDQDHLEFMHPYFRRDHPELLANIKRKVPNSKTASGVPSLQQLQHAIAFSGDGNFGPAAAEGTLAIQTRDLTSIFDELKNLRDRQKNMEMRMDELTKENEMLWTEMAHVRGTHLKQQQIVNKLIQFLVALVGPTGKQQGRLGKRHISGRSVNGGSGSSSTAAATHQQLQSILPANASEILDRLMSDIGTPEKNGPFVGTSAGNYIFEHKPGNGHFNLPTQIDSNGTLVSNLVNPNDDKLQIQPYIGRTSLHGPGSSMATSPQASGPIIAELFDEMEDGTTTVGEMVATGFQQQMGTMPQTGQPMTVVVSSPMTPIPMSTNIVEQPVLATETGKFRGYSQSFGGQSAPPAKRQAFQMGHKQQQSLRTPQAQQPTMVQIGCSNRGGRIRQQPQSPPQQQQPLVIYQTIPSQSSQFPIQQQQQPVVMVNPQQSQQQPPQMAFPQQQQIQQMQPMERYNQQPQYMLMPTTNQQQLSAPGKHAAQFSGQIPLEQQPQIAENHNGGNALPYAGQGQQQSINDTQNPLDTPLTEGMLLNEHEMADIAGLNAYLDENDARFQSLTNSIAEHWDNVSMGGGEINSDDLHDLFDYGESSNRNRVGGQQVGNNPNALSPFSGQHFAGGSGDGQQQHIDSRI